MGITWKENFLLDGKALGQEQQAKDLLGAYEKRAKDFGAKLGDAAARKVSIVRFLPGNIRVYGPDSFSGIVIGDTGLGRPERQLLANKEDKRFDLVSPERINEVDGDVIFVTAYGDKAAAEQTKVDRRQPVEGPHRGQGRQGVPGLRRGLDDRHRRRRRQQDPRRPGQVPPRRLTAPAARAPARARTRKHPRNSAPAHPAHPRSRPAHRAARTRAHRS